MKPPSELRRSLHLVTTAWVFGSLWLYIVSGAALTRYAQLFGMPKFGFGLLAALPFAGALVQLPASYCIQRYGQRKRVFIIAGVVHRLLWVAVALIPWMLPAGGWWSALLWLVALSWVAGHVATPAWVSWMADLVPAKIRGRYFSRRMQVGQLVGLATTITIGYVLDVAGDDSARLLMQTLALAFALAGAAGAVDFLLFLPVSEPPAPPDPQTSLRELVARPLADRNFRRFLAFTATLTFSMGFVGQFAWLYVFNVVGMSNTRANVLLVVMPLVVFMIFYPLWGRLIDRLGCKPVLIIAGIFITPGAAAWIFVTGNTWLAAYLAVVIACAAWPGVELANFNILLGMSRASGGQRRPGGYVALSSLVAAGAGMLSGVFGGLVAETLEDWRGMFFGRPLTYHGVLFLISAGLRLAALGWLFALTEPRAYTPLAALRYMGTNLYGNLQQAIFMPGRVLLRWSRWTYQVSPGHAPSPRDPPRAGGDSPQAPAA